MKPEAFHYLCMARTSLDEARKMLTIGLDKQAARMAYKEAADYGASDIGVSSGRAGEALEQAADFLDRLTHLLA